jgi:DNA-directed RNA polymerase I subunit RPA1
MHKGPDKQIIRKKIEGFSFGLLASDEVRRASVVQITTPLSFNQFGVPLPGGLYDTAMGKLHFL